MIFSAICLDLSQPSHGGISYSSSRPPRTEGTTAEYICDNGYQLPMGVMALVTTCLNSTDGTGGVWSVSAPLCAGIQSIYRSNPR